MYKYNYNKNSLIFISFALLLILIMMPYIYSMIYDVMLKFFGKNSYSSFSFTSIITCFNLYAFIFISPIKNILKIETEG